jgi:hypothetical protein
MKEEITKKLIDDQEGQGDEMKNMDILTFHNKLFEDYSKNKFKDLERSNTPSSRNKILWLARQLNNTESTLSIENMQPKLLSENNK